MLFVPADPIAVSSRPRYIAVTDLDGDGLDDVVLTNSRETVTVLYGSATAPTMFEAPLLLTQGKRLRRATTGDTNADGLVDIVVADERQRGVYVIENAGNRKFAKPRFVPTRLKPFSVAVAAIDDVAGGDILVGERRSGRIEIRYNKGNQIFTNGPILSTTEGLERLECDDMNGDQLPELVGVTAGRFGRVTIFPASRSGRTVVYPSSISFTTDANKANLVIEDLDQSGTMDLALLSGTRGRDSSQVEITLTDGSNEILSTETVETSCPQYSRSRHCRGRGLTAADFDGDGIIDLAIGLRNQSLLGALGVRRSGVVSFLRGRGDTFVPDGIAPWLERTPEDIAAGDFNGDGRPDIVAITKTRSLVQAMLNISSPGPTVRGERRRTEATTLR